MSSNALFVAYITNGINDIRRDIIKEVLVELEKIDEGKSCVVDDLKTKLLGMISVIKPNKNTTKEKKYVDDSDSDSVKVPNEKYVDDSDYFTKKNQKKDQNDYNNEKRECILAAILNDSGFLNTNDSTRWLNNVVRERVKEYFGIIENISCIRKGGRGSHCDFELEINNTKFPLEFKFNASCLEEIPQFVSPMKPSRFCYGPYGSYEEFFYDNYVIERCKTFNLSLPPKELYLKQIHGTNPECIKEHVTKNSKGRKRSEGHTADDIKFHENCKESSLNSIHTYIQKTNIDKDKLTEYLLETQLINHKEKVYMLYKDRCINFATINKDTFIITEITKHQSKKGGYFVGWDAKTKSGRILRILLRWKNGNGIAFTGLQISIRKP